MSEDENSQGSRRRTRSASRALNTEEEREDVLLELPEDNNDNEEDEENQEDNDDASTDDDEDEADDEADDGDDDDENAQVKIPTEVTNDEEVIKMHDVPSVLKLWEEKMGADGNTSDDSDDTHRHTFDPVPILTRLAEILEHDTAEYMKLDPDPYDDRHPSRMHTDCRLGASLKALYKREIFINKLKGIYLKEIWGEDLDLGVNTVAARLLVSALPGMESAQLFEDCVPLITRFFQWAEFSPEPLQSYSLGLLGAAMENSEIAGKFKEKNVHLVQVMLGRLKTLQHDFFNSQRPFAHLGNPAQCPESDKSHSKVEIKCNGTSINTNGTKIIPNGDFPDGVTLHHAKDPRLDYMKSRSNTPLPVKSMFKTLESDDQNRATPSPTSSATVGKSSGPGTPTSKDVGGTPSRKRSRQSGLSSSKSFVEPVTSKSTPKRRKLSTSVLLDDCSSTSSSWAEMESNIIGQWQVHPVNLVSRQIFTLRYVAALGEYQEMLSYAFENSAVQIILKYVSKSHVNSRETSRLTFEALKYLGALLCHKKFAMEFLGAGGLQKLLQVPRPSISATGVALCLYYLAYCEDAMERVCLMSKTTLQNVISYGMWLLECSHNSGRNHALMFFSCIYPFKIILDMFDSHDGLRSVLNVISTQSKFASVIRSAQNLPLPIGQLREMRETGDVDLTEDEQLIMKHNVRQVSFNLKRYFECHLFFTADKLKRTIGRSQNPHQVIGPMIPHYKAIKFTNPVDIAAAHQTVLSLLPVNAPRWAPVERFLSQFGIHIIMTTIRLAYDWNYSGRQETAKNMLDVLAICCLVPKAQLMLLERYVNVGTSSNEQSGMTYLLGASEGGQINEPELKKSALQALGNCVCGSIHHKKPTDTQIKLWECCRMNNGILVLTRLLLIKTPISDADSIRAMACWCLSGLARYKQVRQVLQQLPLIRSGLIQNLMTEPILQDKRQDHVMFQKYALEIFKLVHGKDEHFSLELGDIIRKTDLISQTRISYDERQLFQLIQNHLANSGLSKTALMLKQELGDKQMLPINAGVIAPSESSSTITTIGSSSPLPKQISKKTTSTVVTLDKIVKEYLLSQHALCKTPMVTCPQFDLLNPHKCPSKTDFSSVFKTQSRIGVNFASKLFKRELSGYGRGHEERKLIYSKYKPCRVIRSGDMSEDVSFTSCAFSPCYQWTIVGTNNGDVKLFNNATSAEDGSYSCHESEISHLQPNNKGSLLLTSSIWRRPLSGLWRMEGLFDKLMDFDREEYVEFNKCGQNKVIATNMEHAAVYDLETKKRILSLHPRVSNTYLRNRATFDPFDDLILSDGVLWDFKSGKEIHKFDKLNENLSGVFNPKNGVEIISNTEIWDIRTFHLLKTVRQLDQCLVQFSHDCNIIYGYKLERDEPPDVENSMSRYGDSSFVVLDNYADYASIATIELKRNVGCLAVSPNDLQLALVENHAIDDGLSAESCVRYYEVGRSKADDFVTGLDDEDDLQSDDEDDDEPNDDEDDDEEEDDVDEDEGNDNDLDHILDELLPRDGDGVDVVAFSDGEGGEFVFHRNEDSDDSDWEENSDSDTSSF